MATKPQIEYPINYIKGYESQRECYSGDLVYNTDAVDIIITLSETSFHVLITCITSNAKPKPCPTTFLLYS